MDHRFVVCLVTVITIIIFIVFLTSDTASSYCNCTGMATSFDRAPYTFWKGADRSWPLRPDLPYDKSGFQRLSTAYDPSDNVMRDLIRDKQDGLIGPESTGEMLRDKLLSSKFRSSAIAYVNGGALTDLPDVWPSANKSNLVSLERIRGDLPPGAVEYNAVRYGNGKYTESAPVGTFRYGGYGTEIETNGVENAYGNVNNYYDLKVGVL